jgi:aspartyl aminopeptidase
MELNYSTKNAWEIIKKEEAFAFSEDYKKFISGAKTERESVQTLKENAIKNGYKDLFEQDPGSTRYFAINDNKNILLLREGSQHAERGMNFIFAHIDSPRVDIKQNPLYEGFDIAMFRTHYYGGIKKYQWVTVPLALHGVIILKNGQKLEISIGEKEEEPVFVISDLLPHLAKKQMEQNAREFINAESLDPIVGSIPVEDEKEKDRFKNNVLKILNGKYGIVEEDFLSSELTLVPAGKARDVGFDESSVLAYGHDDRICAYTSARAIFDADHIDKTAVVLLFDKEEIGSDGLTGAQSDFIKYAIEKYLKLKGKTQTVKEVLFNSFGISGDVNAALDPLYPDAFEAQNAAIFGRGVVVTKYTGSGGKSNASDASAELVFGIRTLFNENKVPWQMAELGKVDVGGSGTVAKFLAGKGIATIDVGPGLLSTHAPYEIVSKADLYSTYLAYKSFIEKFEMGR